MLVSIIIPTYNREHVLKYALQSIVEQSYVNWELIVSDDGSTDNTEQIITEFAHQVTQQVTFIKAINNQGVGCARNAGIDNAKGDLIAFLDSDDRWLENHLKNSIQILEDIPSIDWVSANYRFVELATNEVFIEDGFHSHGDRPELSLEQKKVGNANVVTDPLLIKTAILHGHMAPLGSSVFRIEIFDIVSFPNARMHEDTVFWVDALIHKMKFAFIEDIHLVMYDHDARTVVRELSGNQSRLHKLKAHLNSYQALSSLNKHKEKLTKDEFISYNQRLSNLCFWIIGYECYLRGSDYKNAYKWFIKGLLYRPLDKKCWRTFFLGWLNMFKKSQ